MPIQKWLASHLCALTMGQCGHGEKGERYCKAPSAVQMEV